MVIFKVIFKARICLTGKTSKDDAVRVKVQHPFLQEVKGFAESYPGPADGKAGDGDVEVGRDRFILELVFEVDLDPLFR